MEARRLFCIPVAQGMFMFLRVLQTRLCFVAATESVATIITIKFFIDTLYCHSLLALFAVNCEVYIIKKPVILVDTRFVCQVQYI